MGSGIRRSIIRSRAHVAGCRARARQIDRADAPETAEVRVVLAGTAAAALLVLPPGPDRRLGHVAAGAAVGIVAVSVAWVYEGERGRPLRGRADRGGVSLRAPVQRGEPSGRRAGRPARVGPQAPQPRRALRAHVELDRTPRSPATVRCANAPAPRPRRAPDVVERIAASFERGACDRRRSSRWSGCSRCAPATLPGEDDPAELGHRLHRIARLLKARQ